MSHHPGRPEDFSRARGEKEVSAAPRDPLMPPPNWDTVRDGPWGSGARVKPAAEVERGPAPKGMHYTNTGSPYADLELDSRPGDDVKLGATKKDAGKADLYTLFLDYFPNAVAAVANVSEYGARKYHEKGWLKVPDGYRRYSNADLRHLKLECTEGPYDDGDSGLAHASQHAWNALARLELALRAGSIEDRRGNDIVDGKPVLGTARRVG